MSGHPTNQDKFQLETALFLLGMRINKAMTSSAVISAVLSIFNAWEKDAAQIIKTHPGNYWLYRAIDDSVELTIINTKETIARLKLEKHVHGWAALRSHRHILSHPGQSTYKHADVQRFYDNRQHVFDPKVIRLWGVLASINEWVSAEGLNTRDATLPQVGLYPECIDSVCSMLTHALIPGVPFPTQEVGDHTRRVFAQMAIECQNVYAEEKSTGVMRGEKAWEEYQAKRAQEKAQRDLDSMVPDAPKAEP